MRWRLILKGYSPEIVHIQGSTNIAADTHNHLELDENENTIQTNIQSMVEHFALDRNDLLDNLHSVNYKTIMKFQQKDKTLIETANIKAKSYYIKHFHGADKKYSLISRKGKTVIPDPLQVRLAEWYLNTLCHPGETRMELSISPHF